MVLLATGSMLMNQQYGTSRKRKRKFVICLWGHKRKSEINTQTQDKAQEQRKSDLICGCVTWSQRKKCSGQVCCEAESQRNFCLRHVTHGHSKPSLTSTGKLAHFKRCLCCEIIELAGGTDFADQENEEEFKKKKTSSVLRRKRVLWKSRSSTLMRQASFRKILTNNMQVSPAFQSSLYLNK